MCSMRGMYPNQSMNSAIAGKRRIKVTQDLPIGGTGILFADTVYDVVDESTDSSVTIKTRFGNKHLEAGTFIFV